MKKFITQKFGTTDVLFSVQEINSTGSVDTNNKKKGSLNVNQTSASEAVVKKVKNIRHEIKEMIIGFGSDIDEIKENMKANSLELEFSIAISAEGKLIVGAKAEGTLSFKITWEK